jgi:acyl-CoA thioesterase-1
MRPWQGIVVGLLGSTCANGSAPTAEPAQAVTAAPLPAPPPRAEPAPPVAKEDRVQGKTVLHIGDSMVGGAGGLTKALEARFAAEGAKVVREYKVSESIVSFDRSPRLAELARRHEPDIVVLTLGTNDALVPHPEAYAANVRNIVKRISTRECYWIGPPLWKPDTGIVAVLRENVAPCRFFDSSKLDLQRRSDGIHPTDKGGADWAAAFWAWLPGARAAAAP